MEARITELENFRVKTHNKVVSLGILLKTNNAKTCEFVDVTLANEV